MAALRRIVSGVTLALVLALLLAPNTFLRFLRVEYRWIGRAMFWVEIHSNGINLAHILAFVALGFATRLALAARTSVLLAAALALAVASELAQFWVPGRTPRLSDVALDLAGALLGIAAAALLVWMGERAARPAGP